MESSVGIGEALNLVIALMQNATQISQLIADARENGKDVLDIDAWKLIVGNADSSDTALDAAIQKAKGV